MPGTGLANLRERLRGFFGAAAQLELHEAAAARRCAPRSSSRRAPRPGAAARRERADRADRRRRAAAARAAARAPGAALARARGRRRGAQRPRGGRAVRRRTLPQVVFLDVHMPGLNGIEAARAIARRAEIVFVTALRAATPCRPSSRARSTTSSSRSRRSAWPTRCTRLKSRLRRAAAAAVADFEAVLDRAGRRAEGARRRRARAATCTGSRPRSASSVRLIPVEQIAFLRSDEKYTLVVWEGGEALIRKPIRELADELDPETLRADPPLGDRQPAPGGRRSIAASTRPPRCS